MSRPTLLALAPLRIEATAIQRGARNAEVVTTGQGPQRARRAAINVAERCRSAGAVAIAGFCGATTDDLSAGDVIVADTVMTPDGSAVGGAPEPPTDSSLLVAALQRHGLHARRANVASTDHLVRGEERAALARAGAAGVDMESAWLLPAARGRPHGVIRVVVDTPGRELMSAAIVSDGLRAYRALRTVGVVLDQWAAAVGPHTLMLAGPRSFCAGVERAIDIVERALERFGAPVFVRKQIVHNLHVVEDLESRGAVFVEELDEVPDGATVVFSAHGVAPAVRDVAERRGLRVIDATCPLVAKVHTETRRFADQGYDIVLIGHRGHEEIEGTLGEHPGVQLVEDAAGVGAVEVRDPARVAYLTQTTLAVDETKDIVDRLRARFGSLAGPRTADICYATQNRQDAVRALASACDVILVVGSANSSNSRRLVEVAERGGCPAYLVDDERDIDLRWLAGTPTIGVTAGASAPESMVQRVTSALGGLGPVTIEQHDVTTEHVHFPLPAEVR